MYMKILIYYFLPNMRSMPLTIRKIPTIHPNIAGITRIRIPAITAIMPIVILLAKKLI